MKKLTNIEQTKSSNPNAKLGFSKAMANGWVEVDKKNPSGPKVLRKVETINDEVQLILTKIQSLNLVDVPEKSVQDLKKRKLIAELSEFFYFVVSFHIIFN